MQLLFHRTGQIGGIGGASHDHVHRAHRVLRVWQIKGDTRARVQRVLLHPADDSNNRNPRRAGVVDAADVKALSHRILTGPKLLRHVVVDDGDAGIRGNIVIVEEPARDQRNLHRLEVMAADHARVGVDELLAGWRHTAFDRNRTPGIHLAQRQRGHASRSGHAGQTFQPLPHLVIASPDRLIFLIFLTAHGELHGQNIARIESRRHVSRAQKTADQQPRADQQHGAQRQFGNHQQMAKTVPAPPDGTDARRGPAGVLQSVLHIDSRSASHRCHAEQHRQHHRDGESEQQRRSVDADVAYSRHALRPEDADPMHAYISQ